MHLSVGAAWYASRSTLTTWIPTRACGTWERRGRSALQLLDENDVPVVGLREAAMPRIEAGLSVMCRSKHEP